MTGNDGRDSERIVRGLFGVYDVLSEDELARVPTSTLIRDVIKHECDDHHASPCGRCDDKLAEIDRRLPTRAT